MPNAADHDDYRGDDDSCRPFHLVHKVSVFCDNVHPVYDDLHQTLDLADPVDEDRKQNNETPANRVSFRASNDGCMATIEIERDGTDLCLPVWQYTFHEEPCNDGN